MEKRKNLGNVSIVGVKPPEFWRKSLSFGPKCSISPYPGNLFSVMGLEPPEFLVKIIQFRSKMFYLDT